MAEGKSANESVHHPFVAFNFAVEIRVDGVAMQVCDAAFSECDGLELTMDVKTIREGGNNGKQIRLTGPYNYGNVTLKRGMTSTFDLWKWMDLMLTQPALRADADVIVFAPDRTTERARFRLTRCVPVKLKAPPLNAKDGMVAIEELQLSYESLTLKDQDDTSGA
ncbi:MAG: phage tail protein [Acidobacteria bacterium]|nr:phage tail protein [Acidobacteriota bacterium]